MKLKDCKSLEKIPVIYGIKNIITNKWYIGSCKDLNDRFIRHRSLLKHNSHHSPKLQNSYNLYGEDAFEVFILHYLDEEAVIEEIIELENNTILQYNSIDSGYNMIPATKHIENFTLSEDAKEKVAKTHRKEVVCINRFTNQVYKVYESLTAAAKDLNLETTNISNVCKKESRLRFLKDFVFIYKNEFDPSKDYRVTKHHMLGIPKSDDWKTKARLHNKRAKKIYQYDLQNNLIAVYPSRSEAERQNNLKKEFLRKHRDIPINGYIYTHLQK